MACPSNTSTDVSFHEEKRSTDHHSVYTGHLQHGVEGFQSRCRSFGLFAGESRIHTNGTTTELADTLVVAFDRRPQFLSLLTTDRIIFSFFHGPP